MRRQPRREARRVQPAGHAGTRVRRRRSRPVGAETAVLRVAGAAPQRGSRSITTPPTSSRRFPQEGHRQGQHHVAGSGRRGVVLRLDRQRAPQPRREQLHEPLHAAACPQHLERQEHRALPRARRRGTRRACRSTRVRRARRRAHEPILVRAGARRLRPRADARVPRQQEGVGVLPVTTAVVPEAGDLVGRQREEGRNQGAPARHPHRRLRARPAGSSSSADPDPAPSTSRSRSRSAEHVARSRCRSRGRTPTGAGAAGARRPR